jgi:hypothetical protein
MTQVTDKMIEAARSVLVQSSGGTYFPSNMQVRAAIEIALEVQKADGDEPDLASGPWVLKYMTHC